ncbi:hypothetical protein ELI_13375 [Erythrobacter litoralis HTCC2594]|uniref:Uncharacterized protein n=1 Tax=Erythrobacter litoralis (strain HTCC2594) TaxID=314225 RepID=Q2N6C4_ERYLH|nr:hypothetical protein ELI_13375 [Erythrobacter litoralis HTCC2594]
MAGCLYAPAYAQTVSAQDAETSLESMTVLIDPEAEGLPPPSSGQAADPVADDVGRRISGRERIGNVDPLGRIRTRIDNRVPNRLNTRLDRGRTSRIDNTAALEYALNQNRRSPQTEPKPEGPPD